MQERMKRKEGKEKATRMESNLFNSNSNMTAVQGTLVSALAPELLYKMWQKSEHITGSCL